MITLLNGESYLEGEIVTMAASDEFYYNYLGKHALSSSILRNVYDDMNQQLEYMKRDANGTGKDSEALMLGKLAHWCWLEPDVFYSKTFVDAPRINSPEYVAAIKEHGSENVFKDKHRGIVEWWCRKLDNNEIVRKIRMGADVEIAAVKMIQGFPVRGKADMIKGDTIYDLKTGIVSPKDFEWKINAMHYDLKAWIYMQLFPEIKHFKFIYINKKNRALGFIGISEEAIERGGRKFKMAVDMYMDNFHGKELDEIEYSLDQYIYVGEAR